MQGVNVKFRENIDDRIVKFMIIMDIEEKRQNMMSKEYEYVMGMSNVCEVLSVIIILDWFVFFL